MIEKMEQKRISFLPKSDIFQSILLEMIPERVMLVSPNLQPIYLNPKAREICQ